MTLTKLLAVVGMVGTIGGIVGWFSQQRTIDALRESEGHTRQQVEKLSAENTEVKKWKIETTEELERFRAQSAVRPSVRVESNTPKPVGSSVPRQVVENGSQKLMPRWDPEKKQRQLANWHRQYDEFFQQQGLNAAQVDRILELFALQAEAREDLQAAVEKSGLSGDTPGVESLRSQLYEPILREMREIFGADGYNAYNLYQRTSFYRIGFVDRLQRDFSMADVPLSLEQKDRLAGIVAANDHPKKRKSTDIGTESQIDWEAVSAQANGVLTPSQLTVLQAYGTQQKSGK